MAEIDVLMEQLVKETEKFTKMLYAGFDATKEFWECEGRLRQLHTEILARSDKLVNEPKPFPLSGMIF
jgi:hypothetical protein